MHALPWRDLKYALWLPLYLSVFVLLERIPGRSFWATQLPLDRLVPFCPWMVVFYCLWYPLLVLTGLWLWARHPEAFRRYMRFLSASFLLSEILWFLLPSVQTLRPELSGETGLFTGILAGLYRIDTPTNVFPSVHVAGAVGAALAIQDGAREHPALGRWAWVLAAMICLSTVCVKQHALLDVAGALVLSMAVAAPVYLQSRLPRARQSRPAAWRRIREE